MLNRRILRIKAMQTLYAFEQSKNANFQVAQDFIRDIFVPDLNSMQVQDRSAIEMDKNTALSLFLHSYHHRSISESSHASPKIYQTVTLAINQYHQSVEKDRKFLGKAMTAETETLFDTYLSILSLLIELSEKAAIEKDRVLLSKAVKIMPEYKLATNQITNFLRNNPEFQDACKREGISWELETDFLKDLYTNILKKDTVYQDYLKLPDADFDQDKEIIDHILRNIIFKRTPDAQTEEEAKNPPKPAFMQHYFEHRDIYFAENHSVLKNMVLRTFKSILPQGNNDFKLVDISPDWEIDKEFFRDLYYKTINNTDEYDQIISQKAENWDTDRFALVDKIFIRMAITEMRYCDSIPVKVSINEYVDLCKTYSTPKSKTFVNGMLNKIAEELTEKGEINKSARGLMDNK